MKKILHPGEHSKPYLRRFFSEKRKVLLENYNKKRQLDLEIEARFLMSREYAESDTVLIYVSLDFEIDTYGVIAAALANGKTVGVPRCGEDVSMSFCRIRSLDELSPGAYGILEPAEDAEVIGDLSRSVCVIPCLCADMRGYRVGFGKGYYDRFLAGYDGYKVSLCYADALIPEIIADDYDIPTDVIFTENFTRRLHA